MTPKRTPSAAAILQRQVRARQRRLPDQNAPVEDDVEQAIARKLESRGIANVAGLPDDREPMQWYDLAIESHRQDQALEQRRQAERQAEEAAKNAPRTAAGMLSAAITEDAQGKHIPLNGAAVLRAALGGAPGTINSESTGGR